MISLSLVLAASVSLGGPIEIPQDQYARATFEFTNGDRGELACREEHCSIKLHVFDHDYLFDEHTPGLSGIFPIIPRNLDLSKLDASSRTFWFGLDFECPPRVLESHPGVTCAATTTVVDGRIQSVRRFATKDQFIRVGKEME